MLSRSLLKLGALMCCREAKCDTLQRKATAGARPVFPDPWDAIFFLVFSSSILSFSVRLDTP